VVVCKASVESITKSEAEGGKSITEVACDRKEESSLMLAGELRPQMRDVEKLVPKTTVEDLDKPIEEIDLGQYLKSKQDEDDDEECDQRCCNICEKRPIQFQFQYEERRHRESQGHIERLKELSKTEVWNCLCCGLSVENTKKARLPDLKDEDDNKRLFIAHLRSDVHQDKVRKYGRSTVELRSAPSTQTSRERSSGYQRWCTRVRWRYCSRCSSSARTTR